MRRSVLISLLVVVAAGCGSAGNVEDQGGPTAPSPTAPPSPTEDPTHDISGTFTLQGHDAYSVPGFDPFGNESIQVGDTCVGDSGFDDIAGGTQVVVSDGSGSILASSRLDTGGLVFIASGVGADLFYCEFDFVVSDVPETDFYNVEVSHRGELTYSFAEMEQADWQLALTLG